MGVGKTEPIPPELVRIVTPEVNTAASSSLPAATTSAVTSAATSAAASNRPSSASEKKGDGKDGPSKSKKNDKDTTDDRQTAAPAGPSTTEKDGSGAEQKYSYAGPPGSEDLRARFLYEEVLKLYQMKFTADTFNIYDDNCVFADPAIYAVGKRQVAAAWRAMPKVFKVSETIGSSWTGGLDDKGHGTINIDIKQRYVVKAVSKEMIIPSLSVLEVSGGKVVRHEDRWDHKPLSYTEGGLGLGYGMRRFVAGLTSLCMGPVK